MELDLCCLTTSLTTVNGTTPSPFPWDFSISHFRCVTEQECFAPAVGWAWDRFWVPILSGTLLIRTGVAFFYRGAAAIGPFSMRRLWIGILVIGGNIPGETRTLSVKACEDLVSLDLTDAKETIGEFLALSFSCLLAIGLINRKLRR